MTENYLTSIVEFLVAVVFSYIVSGLLADVFDVLVGFRGIFQLIFFVIMLWLFYQFIRPKYLRSR
jgi:hypothetical protein